MESIEQGIESNERWRGDLGVPILYIIDWSTTTGTRNCVQDPIAEKTGLYIDFLTSADEPEVQFFFGGGE